MSVKKCEVLNPAFEAPTPSMLSRRPLRHPKRILRHLAVGHQLLPGSRILEIGCGAGELTRALHELSMDVTAYEPCAESIQIAMRELPEVEFHRWHADQNYLGSEREYDLVLVHCGAILRGDLLSEQTLRMTSDLASRLQPGGALVFLIRLDPTWNDSPNGHLPSCYRRLLTCFPGASKTLMIPDSLTDRRTWNWLLGRQPRSGHLLVSLQISDESLTQFQWQQIVEREIAQPREPCCLWARLQSFADRPIRRAA